MNSNIDIQNSTKKEIPKPIPTEDSKSTPILKKCVWRPVLGSALGVPWPTLSQDAAEQVLEGVTEILRDFTSQVNSLGLKQNATRKRKTKRKHMDDTTSRTLSRISDIQAMDTDVVQDDPCPEQTSDKSCPPATGMYDDRLSEFRNRVPDTKDQTIILSPPTDPKLGMNFTPPIDAKSNNMAKPDPTPPQATETSTCATKLAERLYFRRERAKSPDQVIVGIKVITQMLESRIRELQSSTPRITSKPKTLTLETRNGSVEPDDAPCQRQYIFVCRDDLNPTSVVDHLPLMIASLNRMLLSWKPSSAANQAHQNSAWYLISLPRGSSAKLSLALGIKRTAAVAISGSTPGFNDLISLIHAFLEPPYPPSLKVSTSPEPGISLPTGYSDTEPSWIPTHIKHYKSTVPLDMKKAKLEKARSRQEKRLRRRIAKISAQHTAQQTPVLVDKRV